MKDITSHPGFFRLERLHNGHGWSDPRTNELCDDRCWSWQIGISMQTGCVDWFEAPTLEDAVQKARAEISRRASRVGAGE